MAENNTSNGTEAVLAPTCMNSVNRIAKLPVVESTIQTAHDIYGKVKDYNSVTNWTLQTAEDTANKAVGMAMPYATPVMKKLEDPIKKVDDVLCSGLDYVETKVPAVKMPPKEIYNSTKQYVTPAVETAKSYVDPAMQTAKSYVDPAMQTAKDIVGPAVTRTRNVVEPMVENARHKVDEYLHRHQESPEGQDQSQQTSPQKSSESVNNEEAEIECHECEDDRNHTPNNSSLDSTY
ncbi:unnamed protein product [Ceutorhynchus assimilis]|uniref:Uncharacterized protein n=1 Tax=Ceutorhynchus assimilis TaxID=467358 RepID=A0A9N9QL03_9CUCU|nr:unnamed protein product [Ceutorhynchus assimilis]